MDIREEAHDRGKLNAPRPSSRTSVATLLAGLDSDQGDVRVAAVARLRVIGGRALRALSGVIEGSAAPATRAAALSALEGLDDARVIDLAIRALQAPDEEIVVAAISVLRDWVLREPGTRVLEALTVAALDKARSGPIRLAALDALSDLPRSLVEPLLERAREASTGATADDPTAVRAWAVHQERSASLSELHEALVRARESERVAPTAMKAQEWIGVRGALHVVLARRSSRVALYDLREAFDGATAPLPLDFVVAITSIGDATCLESLARSWTTSQSEPQWRTRLVESAADLARRLRLSGRHAVVKRVRAKWPGFL